MEITVYGMVKDLNTKKELGGISIKLNLPEITEEPPKGWLKRDGFDGLSYFMAALDLPMDTYMVEISKEDYEKKYNK